MTLLKTARKKSACLLCKAEKSRFLFEREEKSFVRCLKCGLIYQDASPPLEEVRHYYEKGYYESFGARNAAILGARTGLYDDFLSKCSAHRRTGKLLDVGAGWGDFLKKAGERGWEVWGIEPSEEAGEAARRNLGDRIFSGTVEAADFPENHFDVITLWNVVDCLPDPAEAMKKLYRWLSPGGLLVLRTPNALFHWRLFQFYSCLRPVLEKFGWKKEASVFLRSNFDSRNLRRLLAQSSFDSIQIKNGKPTQGDAYQVFSRSSLMKAGKASIYFFSRLVEFLSGGRLLVGTNLVAFASKNSLSSKSASYTRIVLKRIALHCLAVLGYFLGLPLWLKWVGKDREIRILLYHNVNPQGENDMFVKPAPFERQLDFLSRNYHVLSLDEAVKSLRQKNLPEGRSAAITFDDGYEDNYRVAYPILRKKNLLASIFLLAGAEGRERRASHLGESAFPYSRLLDWREAKEMSGHGISFGSHGLSHARLKGLSEEVLRRELVESKEKIEKEIGVPVPFFSYPYGTSLDFNERTERSTREAGYVAALSARFGTNRPRTNRFALRRIGIEASDTLFTFRAKLNGALSLLAIFDWAPVRRMLRWLDSLLIQGKSGSKDSPILLISVDFPPHSDGISTISRVLSEKISQRGKKILVLGPKDRGDREFDERQPYRVFRVPGYRWGYLRFLPLLVCAPWVVLRHRVRKIFAMSISYGGVLAWLSSFLAPVKYVVFAHGYEFEKMKTFPWAQRLYLKIFDRAEKVVANSEDIRERLLRFGVRRSQIEILKPGVGLERFRPCEVPPRFLEEKDLTGRKILLTVGRLIERKGHDRVIRALPEIVKVFPDVLYCIVGVGPEEKRLHGEVESLHLENYVRFLGKIPDEELLYFYNACKIFVMPSREIPEGGHIEGFGIVYLEANACAKPVIGGKSGGVPEAVRDGETGFLVDPESSSEIAEKIIDLLSRPDEARKMGEAAFRWVRQTFNDEPYVKEAYRFLTGEELP